MPKNKGMQNIGDIFLNVFVMSRCSNSSLFTGKGGKNYKKGKKTNEGEGTRRELIFKEDGQGKQQLISTDNRSRFIKIVGFTISFIQFQSTLKC